MRAVCHVFPGERDAVREQAVDAALQGLINALESG
jgi:nicotinamide mononucleotide (NMN) deamidase PncC